MNDERQGCARDAVANWIAGRLSQLDRGGRCPTPPRPYLIYYEEGEDSLCADDGNYVQIVHWCAELYVDAKNEQLEKAVANAIASCELPYAKDEVGPTADDAPLLITYRFQTI